MMMVRKSKGLSDRHKKIIEFLEKHQVNAGYPPSIREIGEETGISSTSVVNYYLDQLEKMGYIERDRKISRGVRLTEKLAEAGLTATAHAAQVAAALTSGVEQLLRIPMAGRIGASLPIPTPGTDFNYYDSESSVEIARSLLPVKDTSDVFALEVQGDSMIDAMVNDGDIVIIKPTNQASNGDMVAVWLPDTNETTLKYFFKEKDHYRLQPANPTMKPIIIEKSRPIEIKGKVVMVVRQFNARPKM
jgi:repressor LexA